MDVAQPVRIALDYRLTINRRRTDGLAALQSLLGRLDSDAFKQWHAMLDELGHTGRELDEAFDAFKNVSLADLHQYEQVTECLIELADAR